MVRRVDQNWRGLNLAQAVFGFYAAQTGSEFGEWVQAGKYIHESMGKCFNNES